MQSSPRVGRRRRRVLLKAMACVHCVCVHVCVYVCVCVNLCMCVCVLVSVYVCYESIHAVFL